MRDISKWDIWDLYLEFLVTLKLWGKIDFLLFKLVYNVKTNCFLEKKNQNEFNLFVVT